MKKVYLITRLFSLKGIAKGAVGFCLLLAPVLFTSCDRNTGIKNENGCQYEPGSTCAGFSFSMVNADTYENLIGREGKLIHPDSIVITNTRADTMLGYYTLMASDGWWTVQELNPFEEITCFNPCISDSAFVRTYYLYIGNGDTDTVDVHFPERSGPEVFYNKTPGRLQADFPTNMGLRSSAYFRKKIN